MIRRIIVSILALPIAACSIASSTGGAFVAAPAPPAGAPLVAAVLLPDGRVAAASSEGLAIYDPRTDHWLARPGPPGGGFLSGLVALRDGTLFMLRSFENGPDQRALLYDPANDRWSQTRPMLELRTSPSVTLLEDGRVLIAGGFGREGPSTPLRSAEIFDPSTGSSTATAPEVRRRFSPATALLEDGRVLFAGGDESGSGVLAAETFDPKFNRWSEAGSLPFQAPRPLTVRLGDGRVLLVAGLTFFQGPNPLAEIYDPRANSWSRAPDAPSGGGGSMALLRDGRALLLKVSLTPTAALFRAEIFDPKQLTWSASQAMTGVAHTAIALQDGRVLVIGEGASWIYDPRLNPPPTGQEGLGSPRLTIALAALAVVLALLVLVQLALARFLERRRPTPI